MTGMEFSQLAQTLLTEGPLQRSKWPGQLTVPTEKSGGIMGFGSKNKFWAKITSLRKYTDRGTDKFSENFKGSTGWEYDFQIIYVSGKFVYSKTNSSKDYDSVTSPSFKLEVKSDLDEKKLLLTDRFLLNGSEVYRLSYSGVKEIERRNELVSSHHFAYGFFCHIHSHPQVKLQGHDVPVYTFFSRQDFSGFLGAHQMVEGLVTDRFWLFGKTPHSTMPTQPEIQDVTRAEALAPEKFVQMASDLVSRHEMVLYMGEFDSHKLQRIA